jgi:hypothetical protein
MTGRVCLICTKRAENGEEMQLAATFSGQQLNTSMMTVCLKIIQSRNTSLLSHFSTAC